MESDNELDNLISGYVSELKAKKGFSERNKETPQSSDEQEFPDWESDGEQLGPIEIMDPAMIKRESSEDDYGNPASATDSEAEQFSDGSSDDETKAFSEHDLDGTFNNSAKRKRKTSKSSLEIEIKQEIKDEEDEPESVVKTTKKNLQDVKMKDKKKKRLKKKPSKELKVDRPRTKMEKELMSLVFSGTADLVSTMTKQENKIARQKKRKRPDPIVDESVAPMASAPSKSQRSVAWQDSDDDDDEDAQNTKKNKFARQEIKGQLTNEKRRRQFEQIVGNPKWADLDQVQEPNSDDELLQNVGYVVKKDDSLFLPKGVIQLKMLKNLNRETKGEGEITAINFHPTSMVAIMAGKKGLVSIVAVDGVRNEKLHTIWLPKVRIACSTLSPDGNEAIFGSYRKFYHVYNLISGQGHTLKIPEKDTWLMTNFCVSACGKYLASAGESGEVHLMSAKSKEVLRTIQQRYTCQALAFTPDSRYLFSHSNDTEVTVYSIESKRIVNVFHDEGCVNGSCIAISPNGELVATGSRQGVVNIYPLDVLLIQKQPIPQKTITNLTTYIDSLTFNPTSELLGIASSTVKNAVKLIHIKSGTVFRNFPLPNSQLGSVTKISFSPSGGYLALGNKESTVSLFRVKHYPNY
ncbi:U3 small nucleolar RNA-associated protein 18 homolog [Anopheles nili]|uniref:U3 small nucleolar RNA-associated protein 18 homolog n=1 Tax=Anopheles nili TaxID=185578 RepID=UPI00237B8B8F|nr:U3 small nucleolar RNA-associated protein 18 homolog [Anopheles nili]